MHPTSTGLRELRRENILLLGSSGDFPRVSRLNQLVKVDKISITTENVRMGEGCRR